MPNAEPIENIIIDGEIAAIIIKADFSQDGIRFFTPDSFSQQLAYLKHPRGKKIEPHLHNVLRREVSLTNEVLLVKRGRVRVDFYNEAHEYMMSRELLAGDVILLVHGGHGFEMLEESEIIEVKQGPYAGEQDKVRFSPRKSRGE